MTGDLESDPNEGIAEEYEQELNAFEERVGFKFTGKQREMLKRALTRSSYSALPPEPVVERRLLDLAKLGDKILLEKFRIWAWETEPITKEARRDRRAMQNFLVTNVFLSSLAFKLGMNQVIRLHALEARAQDPILMARKLADSFEAFVQILQTSHGSAAVDQLLGELVFNAPEMEFYTDLICRDAAKMRDALQELSGGHCTFEEWFDGTHHQVRISMPDCVTAESYSDHEHSAVRIGVVRFIEQNPWLIWRTYDAIGEEQALVGSAVPRYRFALYKKF